MAQHQQAAWQSNARYFSTLLSFATTHGKPMAVPEWGLSLASHGGGDDPYFVRQMHDLLLNTANSVRWWAYFDYGPHAISTQPYAFPNSSSLFLQIF
jgi:hypothetical protein